MRHFFSALAIAAVVAAAAPASAQGPSGAPSAPAKSSQGWVEPPLGSEQATAPGGMRRHRRAQHVQRYHRGWRSSADHMANRLNRRELRSGGVSYPTQPSSYGGAYGPSPYSSTSN